MRKKVAIRSGALELSAEFAPRNKNESITWRLYIATAWRVIGGWFYWFNTKLVEDTVGLIGSAVTMRARERQGVLVKSCCVCDAAEREKEHLLCSHTHTNSHQGKWRRRQMNPKASSTCCARRRRCASLSLFHSTIHSNCCRATPNT